MSVSIILPVYNSESYLSETLECALNQSWQDKEIIVVDDGSTDNSLEIARSYECEILKVYTQTHKNASAARNHAFEKSTGSYIQFLDADDLMEKDKIKKQMEFILQNKLDNRTLLYTTTLIFENNITNLLPISTLSGKSYSNPFDLLNEMFLTHRAILPHSYLTPRNLVEESGGWNETLSTNDDGEFFSRIIALSSSVEYIPDTVVYYRNTPQSLSKQRSLKHVESELSAVLLMVNLVINRNDSKETRDACAKRISDYITEFYPDNKPFLKRVDAFMKNNCLEYDLSNKGRFHVFFIKMFGWEKALLLRSYNTMCHAKLDG